MEESKSTNLPIYEGKWINNSTWVWEFNIPEPEIQIVSRGDLNECRVTIGDFTTDSKIGYPALPKIVKVFNAIPEEITFDVYGNGKRVFTLPAPIEVFRDYPKSGENLSNFYSGNYGLEKAEITDVYPEKLVDAAFAGYINGVPITRVIVFPYQLQSDGITLTYYTDLVVTIHLSHKGDFTEESSLVENPIFKHSDFPGNIVRKKRVKQLSKPQTDIFVGKDLMKIIVKEDGVYRITRECLVDSGASIKGVDPRTFQMFNKGYEIPIYVNGETDGEFNESDYIEFIGQRNRNSVADYEYDPFTDRNVYWLTWGGENGVRYANESAKLTVPSNQAIIPTDFLYTMHIEENRSFHRLGQVDVDMPTYTRDHWFFDGGINGGTAKSYFFYLIHPNNNTTKNFDIEVGMHGLAYQSEYSSGKHSITVHINDRQAASGNWVGQVPYIIKNEPTQVLENNFLHHGENKIQITVAGNDPTNKYDNVLLDWFKVKYYRLYRADNDFIDFTRPPGYPNGVYHFKIDNFNKPDIVVYKLGKSKLRDFEVDYDYSTNKYSIALEDNVYDDSTLYYAASIEGIKQPVSIKPDTVFGIKDDVQPTDLLLITAHRWKYNLDELVDFYSEIGIRAKVISINDIYNEFNYGIISPFAIRDFLQYVNYNWNPVPQYVLLIGDAGVKEEESVPTFFFNTYKYGACACDYWFTLVDGEDDELPDFAIGRWPCSTDEEFEILIEKRKRYTLEEVTSPWKTETLFIAGKEDVFKEQSEDMIKRQLPKEFNTNRIYINPASQQTPFWGGTDTLVSLFDSGIAIANFMGHGGGAVWSDRSLFTMEDIPLLDNLSKLPFLTSMTCFTGDFTNVTGLGENMLTADNGGAIGLWGSSSVGWIKNDYLLAKPFYDVIFEPQMTVGSAIQLAKTIYLTEKDYFDNIRLSMAYSYNLIGDPTVDLSFPEEKVSFSLDDLNLEPGDSVNLTTNLPFTSGDIVFNLYDINKYRIFDKPLTREFNASDFSFDLMLPEDINPGESYLNYYVRNIERTQDAFGATVFSVRGLNFFGFESIPATPRKGENFDISISVDIENIKSVICELDTSYAVIKLDEYGMEHVESFKDTSVIARIQMVKGDDSLRWHLEDSISVAQSGKLVGVRFVAIDAAMDSIVSPIYCVKIKREPDIYPVEITQGGTKFPALGITTNYIGDDTLSVSADVYKISSGNNETFFGNSSFELYPNRRTTFWIPGILGMEFETFKVVIDPNNKISESNEFNNELVDSIYVETFPVLLGIGTTYDGSEHDTISVEDVFLISIADISDSSTLIVEMDTSAIFTQQPDFELKSPHNDFSQAQFKARLGVPENLDIDALISFEANAIPDSVLKEVSIGRFDKFLQVWLNEKETQIDTINKCLTLSTSDLGNFSLVTCKDSEPPRLELNIDGQQFFHNSYVSDKPNISIIGEDENGIMFNEKGVEIFIDGTEIDFSELSLPDTIVSGNFISAQFRPELDWGNHVIKVSLSDAAGNVATESIDFEVSDELRLFDYGNYPNPFKNKTVFVYELSQRVESLEIKIYTSSGRLIRNLNSSTIFSTDIDMNESGYHEIMWDGLDRDGDFIANGVYFYKIVAKKDGKLVNSIGKIAKAR